MNDEIDCYVKKYNKNYLKDVRNLWIEQYEMDHVNKREALFKWLTEANQFAISESPYYLLFDGKKVIGMHGHMPLKFSVNGENKNGYLAHDDLLSTHYRGRGLGKIMLKCITEQTDSFAGALWFNEPNHRLYIKSGWLDVPGMFSLIKIFDPGLFIERRIKNKLIVKMFSAVYKRANKIKDTFNLSNSYKRIEIIEIKKFNEAFNNFFAEISTYFGILVTRNMQYLNWKFVNKPFNNYERYAAFDEKKKLSGYIITTIEASANGTRGKILDILVHPGKPNVFEVLISNSLKTFSERNVDYVEIISTHPSLIAILENLGFKKARTPQRFMVKNWEGIFQKDYVEDIRNWYITLSDADGDAWTVGSNNDR